MPARPHHPVSSRLLPALAALLIAAVLALVPATAATAESPVSFSSSTVLDSVGVLSWAMPLGSLAGGYAASLSSAPQVLAVNGGLLTLVAVYFLMRGGVREL